ncbi:MAG TPA: hypothetical protein VKZ99_00075 [Gammaproteobacteria bacterium]|nr:hypothetical protein [Gammaproteobacteria bacterium]
MNEGYAQAINLERLERQLARCAELDTHPPERCARKTVMQSVCPCIAAEEAICNVLTSTVHEACHR